MFKIKSNNKKNNINKKENESIFIEENEILKKIPEENKNNLNFLTKKCFLLILLISFLIGIIGWIIFIIRVSICIDNTNISNEGIDIGLLN